MYLDPGATSLFVQAIFAMAATLLVTFSRSGSWFSGMWARVSQRLHKNRSHPTAWSAICRKPKEKILQVMRILVDREWRISGLKRNSA